LKAYIHTSPFKAYIHTPSFKAYIHTPSFIVRVLGGNIEEPRNQDLRSMPVI
jgi:hypothetical protein